MTTSDSEYVVELRDVTVRHNDLVTLDSVSMTVDKGSFTAIIGPNGAGKTTLLRVILGLIEPDEGTVRVFSLPLRELGNRRSRIGYVPQILPIDVGFPIDVFETVLMGTYGRVGVGARPTAVDREAARTALRKVGMLNFAGRPIRRLSSGQRQRVFIARALANDPELLLLDEPTTGVDIGTSDSLYTLLRELKEQGVTIILVSHDIGVVASYVDSLACLNTSLVAHCRPGDTECSAALAHMYGCDVAFLHHGKAPHIVVEDH